MSIDFSSLFFLHFGFFPHEPISHWPAPVFPFSDSKAKPLQMLSQSIQKSIQSHTEVALLLSGGLDSRIILVELLKHLPPKSIHTITYGSPGTWDFSIGNLLAQKAGTRHTAIDLSVLPTVEQIMERDRANRRSSHPLFSIPWDQFRGNVLPVFTGFLGDWLTELQREESLPHPEELWKKNQGIRNWSLPPIHLKGDPVSFRKFEWEWYYQRGLFPSFHPQSQTSVHPFLDEAVIQAFLSVPSSLQLEQKGYQAALLEWSPEWFKLPVKRTYGLGLHRKPWQEWCVKTSGPILRKWGFLPVNRSTNYADYRNIFEQSEWRDVEEMAMKKLSEWEIDPPKTFEQRLRILPLAW
jgi:hypothetical protein